MTLLGLPAPARGDYAEGMEHYRKAWAAYATQRFDEAEGWAHRAVRVDRENAHAHALLGDLAYLRHDLEGAKGEWAQALALAPHLAAIGGQIAQADLELALESQMEPVQLGSLVVRVPAASVVASSAEGGAMPSARAGGVASPLATLEQAVEGLEPYFRYRPQRPLTVLIYPRESFYATTHLPAQVLGLFDGKIRVPAPSVHPEQAVHPSTELRVNGASKDNSLAGVLWHEYAHALVHDLSHGRAPRWLHEGLAQEAEAISESAGGIASPGPEAPARDGAEDAEDGEDAELPPLKRLLGIADRPGEAVVMPAGRFYAGAHHLTRYLLELKGWDRMRAFLKALGEGRPVEEALQAMYGLDLETLERNWRRWAD